LKRHINSRFNALSLQAFSAVILTLFDPVGNPFADRTEVSAAVSLE
jgi:hypothetical protein